MYLVFSGDRYYPRGGWNDYAGSFNTLAEAEAFIAGQNPDWWHVVYGGRTIKWG